VLIRIDASSFNRQNLDTYYVGYKLHSIDQIQQLKGLLQSMANVAPIYFTRTPIGKRLLQLPPIAQISTQAISADQRLACLSH
jgi:hypothetical protein